MRRAKPASGRSGMTGQSVRMIFAPTFALCLAVPLAGCDRSQPDTRDLASPGPTAVVPSSSRQVETALPLPTPVPVPAAAAPAAEPSASRDADVVASAWAHAVEARDWALVRAYWGEHGAASKLTPPAFAARWNKLAHPQVTLGPGQEDGAAGSLFYDQPVVITDGVVGGKARRLSGHMVWRRVNDVDGASPEQLRWHIESSTLAP